MRDSIIQDQCCSFYDNYDGQVYYKHLRGNYQWMFQIGYWSSKTLNHFEIRLTQKVGRSAKFVIKNVQLLHHIQMTDPDKDG